MISKDEMGEVAMSRGEVFSPSSGCVLPPSTQALLWLVIGKLTKATEVVRYRHEATVSATQTQAVLPPDVLVQKTVTVAFGDRDHTCVLWTGVGDFQIKKEAALLVAECLSLSRRAAKGRTINPVWVDPITAFGMEAGMVSPFLPPRSLSDQRRTPVAALVVQLWPMRWEASKRVAISLSLDESLIIPLRSLHLLLRNYYAWRHPSVPCLFLPSDD